MNAVEDQSAVAHLRGVGLVMPNGAELLRDVDLTIGPGEHWAVIGANGAGKSTLLRIIQGSVSPTVGQVEVAGQRHGAPGLCDPRLRIGILEGAPPRLASALTGLDVLMLRPPGPIATLGAPPGPREWEQAADMLAWLDGAHLRERAYGTCSQGERQRILLARALMRDPVLILLDEPVSALDLPGRESFLRALEHLARRRPELATLTVTHHLEELPGTTTHALLLRAGTVVAAGPVDEALSEGPLSECFGISIALVRQDERWVARLAPQVA